MSKLTREYDQKVAVRKTTQGLKKHIEWLCGQKELYILKAKEAKMKAISSSYSIARSGLKATLTQLKKSEEMLLNIELISQYKDFAKLSNIFVKSMQGVSKELSKEVGKMNFMKAESLFAKAMMAEDLSSDKLENFLNNTQDTFNIAGRGSSALDSEIDELIGNEVNLLENKIDKKLEKFDNSEGNQVKKERMMQSLGDDYRNNSNDSNRNTNIKSEKQNNSIDIKKNEEIIGETNKAKTNHFNFDYNKDYRFPPLALLKDYELENVERQKNIEVLENDAETISKRLGEFGIEAKVVRSVAGPSFSRHEVSLKSGQKISEIAKLESELTMSLHKSVSFELPIIGTDRLGVNVRNEFVEKVGLKQFMKNFDKQFSVSIPLGMNIEGVAICSDLTKMPHLLVGGCTGSGKSVFLNSLIISLMYSYAPSELKLLLVDTKRVEFSFYNHLPYSLTEKIIDNQEDALSSFNSLIDIMEKRYKIFLDNRVRNINEYNERMKEFSNKKMPYIVAIIDEFSDLVMFKEDGKVLKRAIVTLAQKSRACGIHLIIATQRPSVDVIDGFIKANIPSQIAFRTSNMVDSRIIINDSGAASLFGKGDMLVFEPSNSNLNRLQSPFISIEEVSSVVDWINENN